MKKNECIFREWQIPGIKKVLRKMKLTICLLLISVMSVFAGKSYSQTKNLNIKMTNSTVKEVLQNIEKQSEFYFMYSEKLVDVNREVSVDANNKKITEVLDDLFAGTEVDYKVKNRFILLTSPNVSGDYFASQQQRTISGKITDEPGEPLPGVTVLIKGTTTGTVSDFEGNYTIHGVSSDQILVFSFVGMLSQEILVGEQSNIDVSMVIDAIGIEEVIAIGYGTVKKSDLTGSVGSIKNEEIQSTPVIRLDDALRGKVAGLQITPTSSAPDASASIRIRGSNSLSANNEPLFVVDGHIGGFSLNDININSIESVEVLKDASATAIYGSRGSNGVILITTKRGKAGTPRVSLDTYISLQSPMRLLDMLNASEYAEFMNENKGVEVYPNPSSYGEGTNWQEEVYRNNAPLISTTLSISGGNDKSTYYMSGSYLDQDGISINSNMKRYHFRINSDHKVSDKIKIGNSLFLSYRDYMPGIFGTQAHWNTMQAHIAGFDPTLPVKDENGNYTYQDFSPEFANDNPVAWAILKDEVRKNTKILGNVYGEYEIIPGLIYKLNLGVNLEYGKDLLYLPSTLYHQKGYQGTSSISHNDMTDILFENTLSYNKDFGEHNVNGLFGYTRQKIFNTNDKVETRGYATDAFTYYNIDAGAERSDAASGTSERGLESYLFRANYNYQSKYYITASARYDGSSVFAKNNKWGLFPSVALAWRLSNESFIADLGVFDNLKLRASYGALGNPGIGPGASLSQLSQSGNTYIFGTDQHVVNGIAANTLGNPDLKWETTKQLNIGVDAAFLDSRLQVTLDYYDKLTEDLLVEVPLLWLTSFTNSLSNFGSVTNKGLELTVNSVNVKRPNFQWRTTFNIAGNRNKIKSLLAPEGQIIINDFGWGTSSGILKEGEPIGSFYGMVQNGIWNSQEEIDVSGLTGHGVFPGGKRYEDLDGDGVLDRTLDRKIIGDANPDFFGGIMNTLTYKNLELFVNFTFVYGNKIYNQTRESIGTAFDLNVYAEFADRWTPENADSNVPSIAGIQRPQITSNNEDLQDGSFLRMRDVKLTYNIPVKTLNWIQSLSLYVTGTNLLMFDSYNGFDPEINRGFSNTYRGYDKQENPSLKSVTFGVKVDF